MNMEGADRFEHRQRIWRDMLRFIAEYREGNRSFTSLVRNLEGAMDAIDLEDERAREAWFKHWGALEEARAQDPDPTRKKVAEVINEMESFVTGGLAELRSGGLSPLEEAVLEALLAGDHPVLAALRKQIPHATVTSRTMTRVGFFTDLRVPAGANSAPSSKSQLWIGDVFAEIDGLKYGAGFILEVRDGYLSQLEGYSFHEAWPDEVRFFQLAYTGNGDRDIASLDL